MGPGVMRFVAFSFFFQAEDGIRDAQESRGLGDVYKRQKNSSIPFFLRSNMTAWGRVDLQPLAWTRDRRRSRSGSRPRSALSCLRSCLCTISSSTAFRRLSIASTAYNGRTTHSWNSRFPKLVVQ
eukprot:TRINITY_DN41534_c0_g1_i1.p1 TRINITY_DN41534_c0_g1~~TRINITY_DN41534_c0_g1_i1.p1  ORF type:complete len:125 (-),score=11.25 TRINITY_DN41534_c0_g1_i1:207-581(-)